MKKTYDMRVRLVRDAKLRIEAENAAEAWKIATYYCVYRNGRIEGMSLAVREVKNFNPRITKKFIGGKRNA